MWTVFIFPLRAVSNKAQIVRRCRVSALVLPRVRTSHRWKSRFRLLLFCVPREDSATSSENADTHGSNGISVGALESLDGKSRAPVMASPSAPIEGTLALLGEDSVDTLSASADGLPRPTAVEASTSAAGTIAAGPVAVAIPMASAYSDDDDSSRCEASDVENPSELRRSGSNSSISTLGSTSTASSTWPSDGGFVTPARTDIPRGGGRYGGRGRGHVVAGSGGVEGLSAGIRTPASLAAGTPNRAVPDTPSPRSVSSSVHGTPHVSLFFLLKTTIFSLT